ncbi:MAG TPA: alanine racemase [Tenuifilaceae bacterium]|nr:alanine racemase [Tenuifilaceae bacterium]
MNGINRPTLLVDRKKCVDNINFMVSKARSKGVTLRPHFKTHQNVEVGRWFREFGIDRITVSSVPMAQKFAQDGWNDITIAFPFVSSQAENINSLAKEIKLQLVVSSFNNAKNLANSLSEKIGFFLEVDSGQNRSGFNANDTKLIEQTIELISSKSNLRFCGFLTHAGQTYGHKPNEVIDIHTKAKELMVHLKNLFIEDYPDIIISYGDTPSSTAADDFSGINEIRPGNFVFYDMQQASNNICTTANIAAAMACPVVAIYPERNSATIWGGAVHLSKDFYFLPDGAKSFGAICKLNEDLSWSEPIEGLYIQSLSQEHGVIAATNPSALSKISEGEIIAVLPAHSCLAASCIGNSTTFST